MFISVYILCKLDIKCPLGSVMYGKNRSIFDLGLCLLSDDVVVIYTCRRLL